MIQGKLRRSCRWRQPRRATVLLCVLTCLAVAFALLTSGTQTALRARRQISTQLQYAQTELLLEAGVQRAVRRLADEPNYVGGIWELSPETLGVARTATIEIKIAPSQGENKSITVVARLANDSVQVVQLTHEFTTNSL